MPYHFCIPLEVPSKKNSWLPGRHGMYLPDKMRLKLDDFVLMLKNDFRKQKGEIITTDCWIRCFFANQRDKDVDNQITTILDLLQSAGVIENDRLVVEIEASKAKGIPACTISIATLEERNNQ